MKALLISQRFKDSHALGALVRRNGIKAGLVSQGINCLEFQLSRRHRPLVEVFSVHPIRGAKRKELLETVQCHEIVILEGLPVAVACLGVLRRANNVRVHVDVCDSWLRLGSTGRGAGRSLASAVIRSLKAITAAVALRYVSRRANSISYISSLDFETDSWLVSERTKVFIIPNGSPVNKPQFIDYWNPVGPMVVVGDWAYPPNQEMLQSVFKWYSTLVEAPGLKVVGPNLGAMPTLPRGVEIVGWVDEITEAYEGTCCALALTSSGAGVKNKVLEPLALGIPVIATRNALNGIDANDGTVLDFHPNLSAQEVSKWLKSLSVGGISRLDVSTWEQSTEKFACYLRNGS